MSDYRQDHVGTFECAACGTTFYYEAFDEEVECPKCGACEETYPIN